MPLDLASLHTAIAARFPEREAVVQGDSSRSWQEVADRTNRLANVLLDHGLGGVVDAPVDPASSPHDHLAVFMLNAPEYLEAIVGSHRARIAPFNVNYRYTSDELDYLFADADPACVVFHGRFAPMVAKAVARRPRPVLLIQVDDGSGTAVLPGALDYETALSSASPVVPSSVTPSPTDLHILYTGGTTGMPKGVLWEVGALLAGPLGLRDVDDIDAALARAESKNQRVHPTPPLMHGAGMWFALGAWCAGGTVVMQPIADRLDPEIIVETWATKSVEASMIVGDAFARPLIDVLRERRPSLPALKTLGNSGAALRDELKHELQSLLPEVRILDMLGSSETGPQAARQGDAATFRPRPNLAVVAEDFDRLLEPGDAELGWLAQSGPIPRGYLGDPIKTSSTFREINGVRYSVPGDRVRYEEDGTFTLFGRDSTTINTGGEKVFAEEIEDVVRGVDGVVDALVIGQPSERWGQEVVAVVQVAAASTLTDEQITERAAERLARYKLPKRIIRVPEVRRHSNGKSDYAWARSVLES